MNRKYEIKLQLNHVKETFHANEDAKTWYGNQWRTARNRRQKGSGFLERRSCRFREERCSLVEASRLNDQLV